jgi:ubiquinone/menaquinone biosynthesis C-methylase UbiE
MNSYPHQAKLSEEALNGYWSDVSRRHLSKEDHGLSAICYAGMPVWFNSFLDRYQRKAFARLLAGVDVSGARVLDAGTGVGRWARWFAERGAADITGIDLEPTRLAIARSYGDSISYLQMPANHLAFADASFDIVSCVTVLQHVPDQVKREALAEFSRVLKPGGRAAIFEITGPDDAPHVYPWDRSTWQREFAAAGLLHGRKVGEQYTPVLRLLKSAYTLVHGSVARGEIDAMKAGGFIGASRAMSWLLRAAVASSYPVEEAARFLPARFARITGFLLEKES